jgi:hypothetical protein
LEGDFKKTKLKLTWLAHLPDTPAATLARTPFTPPHVTLIFAQKLFSRAPLRPLPRRRQVPLTLREFDHLITKRKVEDDDKIADLFNDKSAWARPAWGDCNMGTLAKGDVIQLERKGYWIVDVPAGGAGPGSPAVLLSIPDGREAKPAADEKAAKAAAAAAAAPKEPKLDKAAKEALKAAEKAAKKAAKAAAEAAAAAAGGAEGATEAMAALKA